MIFRMILLIFFIILPDQKLGLENPVVHDTDMAVRTAVGAVRNLIRQDNEKNK